MKTKAFKIRNDIVHGEITNNIDQLTCKNGIDAIITAKKILETIFASEGIKKV